MVDGTNPMGFVVRSDEHHPLCVALKRRFGFAQVDDLYDLALEQRVRGVQMMHSLDTHGQLDDATLKVLGVTHDGTPGCGRNALD